LGAAGITLSRTTAEELAIDARRFVVLAGDHVQSAQFRYAASQLDVGPASGHVGRYRDPAGLACFGDDLSFLTVAHRVENLVVEFLGCQ